jgi:signal transduction histidine kinase
MSDLRGPLAAALAVEMRTPLARIELAASQLVREAATPLARELAAGISEAVRDLDALIARSLGLLLPSAAEARHEPLGPVLEEVQERLHAALLARGVRLEQGPRPGVRGDPERARRGALLLLRAGAPLVGEGGTLRLGLVADGVRWGLALELDPGASAPGDLGPLLEAARHFVTSHRGELETLPAPGAPGAGRAPLRGLRLWLGEDASCSES